MKINQVIFVGGFSSFYFDDQKAIKQGAKVDGSIYRGNPVTVGFSAVRQAGECISIMLVLEDGQIAAGDCAAVQYSGAGGRDPLFTADNFISYLEKHIAPHLMGRNVDDFLSNAGFFEDLKIEGRRLHTAIRYGLSQALLGAAALSAHKLKTEIICSEFDLPLIINPIKLLGQSGDNRYGAVDKMLIKGVDALPHALINNVPDKLGQKGELLEAYIKWLKDRIISVRSNESYTPDLHIDVYGTVGLIFDHDPIKITDYLARLGDIAAPFPLYIEGPVDVGSRDEQIEALSQISQQLKIAGSPVKIVADEWCNTYDDIVEFVDAECCDMVQIKTPDLGGVQNTVEAILYCRNNNMESYQGGTCNETDISTRTCVHLALAARPTRMLVKPGMGFDEGMTIVSNEMHRSLAILETRQN